MSNSLSGPSLDDYPGYFPASKPPFWTRTKVGVGAGLLGIFFGFATTPGAADPVEPRTDESAAESISEADLDEAAAAAVEEATESLEDRVADQGDRLAAQKTKLVDQKRAAAIALKRVKREAAAAQRRAVTSAVTKARAEERAKAAAAAPAPAPTQPQPLAGSGGSTDPRFTWCYEANDAGYGPYYQGQDPEYGWYDDADNDGAVCES